LFAQLLRAQLAEVEPGAVLTLHRRAADWYRAFGEPGEAIGHALAAEDAAGAAGLITRHWAAYGDAGRAETVRGWLRALGDDRIAADPVVAHCAAMAAALAGDRETVRRWLPIIESGGDQGPLPDGIKSL